MKTSEVVPGCSLQHFPLWLWFGWDRALPLFGYFFPGMVPVVGGGWCGGGIRGGSREKARGRFLRLSFCGGGVFYAFISWAGG